MDTICYSVLPKHVGLSQVYKFGILFKVFPSGFFFFFFFFFFCKKLFSTVVIRTYKSHKLLSVRSLFKFGCKR